MAPVKEMALALLTPAKEPSPKVPEKVRSARGAWRRADLAPPVLAGRSYCSHWTIPTEKQKKVSVPRQRKTMVARCCRAVASPQRGSKAPRTPPKKDAVKAITTPSKTRPRASPSPSPSPQRELDPTVELVEEIHDFKQAVSWEKFGVPGPIFHGLLAKGENCCFQQMLEEVNDAHVKCTCDMCMDCTGGNYPDPHKLPEGLLDQPFVKLEEEKCRLFAYLTAKAAEFDLPPLTKLPAAPADMTLVSRLSKESESPEAEPWLRQVWRLPFSKQVNFFRLVHAICSEVMPKETGPFQYWFRFYGKSLLPLDVTP